jgi:hypothetical protein
LPPTPEPPAPAPQIGFVPPTGPLPPAARQSPPVPARPHAGASGCLWGR